MMHGTTNIKLMSALGRTEIVMQFSHFFLWS